MKLTNLLSELNKDLGKKGKNLVILASNGILTPKGYGIGSGIYQSFMNPLRSDLEDIMLNGNTKNISEKVKDLFMNTSFNYEMSRLLESKINDSKQDTYFAVRSSGIGILDGKEIKEDSRETSLAGQYDSFLKVDSETVEYAIKCCWASLFNKRSLKHFKIETNPEYLNSKMSVIVQEMIPAEKSAIIMTQDPMERKGILGIETTHGSCEALVSGKVEGDLILYNKETGHLERVDKGAKEKIVEYEPFSRNNLKNSYLIKNELCNNYCLEEDERTNLIDIALKIEKVFGRPQDIEAVHSNNQWYIVQSRDITTGGKNERE
tara:strand:+ start:1636 stop:2595 length:960 start_codon:yes stop_codon:yes gene_type:complete